MIILASKQFYELSYFTSKVEAFAIIMSTQQIRLSKNPEYDLNRGDNKFRYASFSRDLLAAPKRNPRKWRFGVILDGELLTDRYSFMSFSYAGVALRKGDMLKIEWIIYDVDDKGELKLFGRKPISISKSLAQTIISTAFLKQYKVKRLSDGRTKYYTNNSDIATFISDIITKNQYAELTRSQSLNEYEERIWNHNENERFIGEYVDISGCVKGIIIPVDISIKDWGVVNNVLMDSFEFSGTMDDLVLNKANNRMTCTIKDGFYIIRSRTNI